MSVLKPRNRLVIFRLNEEEYESLKAAYSLKGARSISDFARSAVLRSAATEEGTEETWRWRLLNLGREISRAERRVRDLLKLLEAPRSQDSDD
jgi:uncharacterized protein (DUF1778 family)